jgi:hypothetical protein
VAATAAEATTTAAAVSDASINAEELAKANFQKVRPSTLPLFPWRHSPLPLPRLDVTSDEFQRYGYLLGGDIRSSNPTADMYATAFLFMKASIFDIIFFKAFKSDLAESMSWAFSQGISSILSNVYSGKFIFLGLIAERLFCWEGCHHVKRNRSLLSICFVSL